MVFEGLGCSEGENSIICLGKYENIGWEPILGEKTYQIGRQSGHGSPKKHARKRKIEQVVRRGRLVGGPRGGVGGLGGAAGRGFREGVNPFPMG